MSETIKTLFEGKWLGLYEKDDWAFCDRPNSRGVVAILPITDQGEIVLIEQFRSPINQRCLEIPAGLIGDEEEFADESIADCAARELHEETGYEASHMQHLLSTPTSPGMTPEITHLYLATGLTRTGEGGGVDNEDIQVHHVPRTSLMTFIKDKQRQDCAINHKIFSSLALATSLGLFND